MIPYTGSLDASLRSGYTVRSQVLDAADFGVPQTRRRLFLLCDRLAMPAEVKPRRRHHTQSARHVIDLQGPWPSSPLYTERRARDTVLRAERAMQVLGRGEPFLIVYYGSDGGGGWQSLDRPLRTMTTIDRFGLVTWKGRTPMLRMLQVPELQRAMGFEGTYSLPFGTRRDRVKLLGNGVCPPVMEAVVRSLTYPASYLQAAE
jgi:DNA (cytosine-5)-methyltransferase 1